MEINLIAAVADNGVIGRDNRLPWHLPGDLRRFKALTMGHVMVMGRRTWESIGRPLPGRTSVVMSRDPEYRAEGAVVVHSLDEAIRVAENGGEEELFVIGGARIYARALPRADRLYLTRVHAEVPGDARFPDIDPARWRRVEAEPGTDGELPHTFEVWERR